MIDDKYYKGFEGEVDVDIYYLNDKNERIGYKLWDGYFENILSGAYHENFKVDGMLNSYSSHEGWYDEVPWKVENIITAIEELNQYDENNIEQELRNMFSKLREITKKLIILFEDCISNGKDIYIDYNN